MAGLRTSRLLALVLTFAAASAHAPAVAGPVRGCEVSVPYRAGEDGYDTFRIPAALRTAGGALLAFAEGRVGGAGDTGNIDVVVKRSTDGGCTWGPLSVVAAGDGDTRGNPAPVVDPRTGRVVLLTSYNSGQVTEAQIMRGEATAEQSRRVFVQTSRDDGRSFSRPRDITADVKPEHWRWYATGPGHAIALTRGPHAGRLVVPSNHSSAPPAGSPDTGQEAKYYGAHALYSDDGGRNWELGFVEDAYEGVDNANESLAAQLPDGRLYFSARDQHGPSAGNRLDSYSSDGGESLDRPYQVQPTLNDVPIVQASVLQLAGRRGGLLFSGPSVPTARQAMAVWRSDDSGRTFRKVLTVSELRAAYSDLVQVDGRTVGLLYETGDTGTYERIEFRRSAVRELGES
ncbi:sialidase family protein [Streptomyces sp. LHD-70]|uniref:sialidase family protein n=1 Tax=Streptomyces sp. LHD-70 TaxID=3072140 RepID=UPI00280F0406|nr:sialidase family protein [Streptomyces sp. LHD-70]MDQ8701041.1 sialidase family protein [Streptomyces sp. LHD-70]